jgi:flagellar capping protein FliD
MSIPGIASGIDWAKMVTELIDQATKPALVMVDKRDRLELKKTLFDEFLVSLRDLQSTLSPLKLASTFKAKGVEISRIDSSGSYKGVLNATVNADAEIGIYDLEVLQTAKSQINRSKSLGTASLSSLGISAANSYFHVSIGGQKVRVDADPADTLSTLADKINTALKTQNPPVQVTATVVDNRLILKSDTTGLGSTEVSQDLIRAVSGTDTLNFSVNPSNGTMSIKSGGTTYKMGVDFDIVNGNQVRWRTLDPELPPPGAVYQDKYTAYVGDTFVMSTIRSETGDVDKGVLPFTPLDSAGIAITSNGITYTRGSDFEVGADGSVYWLKPYGQPAAGASYEITYVAGGGETVTLDIARENRDIILTLPVGTVFADLEPGTAVVPPSTPGGRSWVEGADFDVVQGPNGEAVIRWYSGGADDAPGAGTSYDVNFQTTGGAPVTASATRSDKDVVSLPGGGRFTSTPQGTHTVTYNGVPVSTSFFTPTLDGSGRALEITWVPPTVPAPAAHTNVPASGASYTVTYAYDTNIFTLSDDGNGFLAALELDQTDDIHYTAAQDAVMILDGERVVRSSNQIGESYDNELIKGMTIDLKGVGRVSLDVSQDAEPAVKSLQNFVDKYNAVLEWINVRIVEEELDKDEKEKLPADDYRMKWGLLRGNSLLRDSKNTLRRLTSQLYVVSAASKTSRNAIYGTMSQNGIANPGSFSISATGNTSASSLQTMGTVSVDISIDPGDTLQTIADRINAPTLGGRPNPLRFDANGRELTSPLARASVAGGKLTISGTNGPVTLGGASNILKTLQLDQQYAALSQIGIKLPSDGEMTADGLAGILKFDTSVLMTALETNADDVASFVTSFANRMQTYLDGMVKFSQKEVAAGITTAEGSVVREMNAIDTEVASIDKYLENFQRRLDDKQAALERQFSAAELRLAKLMEQANWLSSVTSQLQANAGGGGSGGS